MSNNIAIRNDLMLDTRRARSSSNEGRVSRHIILFFFLWGGGRKNSMTEICKVVVDPDQKW